MIKPLNQNQEAVLNYINEWLEQEDVYVKEAWKEVEWAVLDALSSGDEE